MQKQLKTLLQNSLVFLDLLMMAAGYAIIYIIFKPKIEGAGLRPYLEFFTLLATCWILISLAARVYFKNNILSFESFTKRTVQVYLFWIISLMAFLFFTREIIISRTFIFLVIVGYAFLLFINRFIYLGISNYFRSSRNLFNKVMIIGYNETAKKLNEYFEEEGINRRVVGFVEEEKNIHELSKQPIFTDFHNTIEQAIRLDVQEIYSTITPEQNPLIYNLMHRAQMECIRFRIVPDLSIFVNQPMVVSYVGDMPVLSLRPEPLDDEGNRIKKRVLDIVISLIAIIFVLSWLLPIIALLIIIESKGPVFFIQLRSGRNNKTFYCYKFRSMKKNDDADKMQATKNDFRITKIGRILRKTSLDEFPQFFNVLKGDMTVVGPRPHMIKHTEDYSKLVDLFMIRQFLKPGITGWAQINGHRGEISDTEQIKSRVNHDLWYLENWNIWLDIKIIFLTVYNVFKGEKNAY